MNPTWTGAEPPNADYPDGPGFIILKSLPTGAPKKIQLDGKMKNKVNHLRTEKIKRRLMPG